MQLRKIIHHLLFDKRKEESSEISLKTCPICGGNRFNKSIVLWKSLIKEWRLSEDEVNYINLQQGYHCEQCHSNLRMMTLAASILNEYNQRVLSFMEFCLNSEISKKATLLEINEAGYLNQHLKKFKKYIFASYPKIDIQNLPYKDNTFNIIIHSDTLEHVENPLKALKECYRVLKKGGCMFYTIPIVYGRQNKKRRPNKPSYHGTSSTAENDYLVRTEYGSNFWVELFKSGFKNVRLYSLQGLSSIAIIAKKEGRNLRIIPYR